MQFRQPGPWLFAFGMIALGVVYLVLQSSPGWPVGPLCLIVGGLGLPFHRTGRIAASVLAVYWLIPLVNSVWIMVVVNPGQVTTWVDAAEALTFLTVSAAFAYPRLWLAARLALCVTLVLFGGIHLLHPADVAAILPGWFPLPAAWPYVTGVLQIAAGAMILAGFRAPVAAFAVGLMWLSWIPLVHLPRLIDAPGAGAEWIFMITALALAGAAWSVGERIASQSGEDLQRSPQ